MQAVRVIVLCGIAVVFMAGSTACGFRPSAEMIGTNAQPVKAVSAVEQPGAVEEVLWGRVPYCNCFTDSPTTRVADALDGANLRVILKEQSPVDGWLYFVVIFDSQSAPRDQVSIAMEAGGAEVMEGPP